jgi:hypothetical protein
MYFMAVQRWPLSASEQVGKIAVDNLRKPPKDYYKRIGPFTMFTDEGIKSYFLYDVEDGREGDAIKYWADVYMSFKAVEGYSIVFEPLLAVDDALALLGLKL